MPVYDYKCSCGATRTTTLSIKETEHQQICHCGSQMVRVYGIGAVTFKGSGWGKDKN